MNEKKFHCPQRDLWFFWKVPLCRVDHCLLALFCFSTQHKTHTRALLEWMHLPWKSTVSTAAQPVRVCVSLSYPFSQLEKCSAVSTDDRPWATRDVTSKRLLTFHTWEYFCLWTFWLLPPWNSKLKFQPLSSLRSFLILKLVINTHPGKVSYPKTTS